MKTKAIICGVVVAAISTFVMSRAHAQVQDTPAVKVVPTDQPDVVKVIYAYSAINPVSIKFMDSEGLLFEEELKGNNLEKGFLKRYNIAKIRRDVFWVELKSEELSARFRVTYSEEDKLSTQLETVTHNFPVLALK